MGCVSLLLCMSSNFNWMLGTVNFTIWVLYIFVLLWIFLSFLSVNYSPLLQQDLSVSSMPCESRGFLFRLVGTGTIPGLTGAPRIVCSQFSDGPLLCGLFSSHECIITFLLNTWGATPCRSLEIHLCAVLSSLWFCLVCSSCRGASRCSSMSTQSRKSARLPWFTFSGKQSWLHGPVTVVQGPKLQKGPCLALILCGHYLELHNNFTFVFCKWNPMRQKEHTLRAWSLGSHAALPLSVLLLLWIVSCQPLSL